MKLFAQIFLCMITVLTLALCMVGYLMISNSFANAVSRERTRALEEYELIKFSLQSGVLSASESGKLTVVELTALAEKTAEIAPDESLVAVFTEDMIKLKSTFEKGYAFTRPEMDGSINYSMEMKEDRYLLNVSGGFYQSDTGLLLFVSRDITAVFREKDRMEERFIGVFAMVIAVSSGIIVLLSWAITRKLKRLMQTTRRIADGNYSERAYVNSTDEIGDLAGSFNKMADTVEDKIYELEKSAREKEDFVANFAHELKTPMTSVIGYADMIYQKDMSRAEIRDAAGYIVNEGMRLEALSLKLMELIVLEKHDFTLVELDMRDIIADVSDTLRPVAEKRGVEISAEGDSAYVKIEFDLFKTLILNLVDNSIKADGKHIQIKGCSEDGMYMLTVSDDGCGMEKEQLSRITEAFYMVDKSRSRKQHGAGLGLSIAAKIAEIHSTELKYESAPGKGTTVGILLKAEGGE